MPTKLIVCKISGFASRQLSVWFKSRFAHATTAQNPVDAGFQGWQDVIRQGFQRQPGDFAMQMRLAITGFTLMLVPLCEIIDSDSTPVAPVQDKFAICIS